MEVREIDVMEARRLHEEGAALFVDVRDRASHETACIPGSLHLHDGNIEDFVRETDPSRTVVVYCYHGNMSVGGAFFLQNRGFQEVFSLRGGFEAWRITEGGKSGGPQDHPRDSDTSP